MRYSLPPQAETVPPAPFPVLGVLAPLLAAGVIWAVTRSPFALLFALLSPVVAVASVLDARLQTRRRARRAAATERATLAELATVIGERLREDRARLLARTPTAGAIVAGTAPGAAMWRTSGAGARPLVLGFGRQPSGIVLDGRPATPSARELVDRAAVLEGVPVLVDALAGVGVCGPPLLARALLRGLVLQLLFAAPPGSTAVRGCPASGWEWLAAAPHPRKGAVEAQSGAEGIGSERLLLTDGEREVLLACAGTAADLPSGCDTVVAVAGAARARVLPAGPTAGDGLQIAPELVSEAQASAVVRALATHPRAAGDRPGGPALPAAVHLQELLPVAGRQAEAAATAAGEWRSGGEQSRKQRGEQGRMQRRNGLAAVLGVREGGGPLVLDLVADGPHAVVGGTTGSGKSELLVTWVCSLAATHSPAEVTFLLVDFKGGSAFDPLAVLPHCVGLLTDLGPGEARRALASLHAEVQHRERLLREAGARDIASCPPGAAPPRLVIVVDEFAAMLTDFPDLHDVFVDLAARGRSLGVHLVLCTQRPSGSVRDALLANCNLRVSLRVNSRADSVTLLGTDAAAALPADPPGRCVVRAGGAEPRLCQVATTGTALPVLVGRIAAEGRERGWPPQRRPWLEPLPAIVGPAELEDPAVQRDGVPGAIVFGLLDVPEQQARRYAAWHPLEHGPLLVLGAARSGKTGLLAAVSRAGGPGLSVRAVPGDPAEAWDIVGSALDELRAGEWRAGGRSDSGAGRRVLLAVDDVDVLLGRMDAEYAAEFADRLAALLREGTAAGCVLVLTAQRLTGALAPLAAYAGRSLLLRLGSRQEHVLAGGEALLYDADLPPGGGWWQGHRVQVARVPPVPPPAARPPRRVRLRPGRTYAVVSTRPADTARRIRAAAGADRLDISYLATERPRLPPADASTAATGARDAIPVLIGDPEEWQAQWAALQAARRSCCMLYDGCTPRDVRGLGRLNGLPPLLGNGGSVWFAEPGGQVERRSWPG